MWEVGGGRWEVKGGKAGAEDCRDPTGRKLPYLCLATCHDCDFHIMKTSLLFFFSSLGLSQRRSARSSVTTLNVLSVSSSVHTRIFSASVIFDFVVTG